MSKSVGILITGAVAAVAVITIVFASFTAATTVYARNTTTTKVQQQVANITNATNQTTTTLSGLNASIIISAINAKIRAIYDHDHSNLAVPTNSNSAGLIIEIRPNKLWNNSNNSNNLLLRYSALFLVCGDIKSGPSSI